MNLCFFSGKIISELDFRFIIGKNKNFKKCSHISICQFDLELENKTIIKAKAYDELADYCYEKLKIGDFIHISGTLNDSYEVEIQFLEKAESKIH